MPRKTGNTNTIDNPEVEEVDVAETTDAGETEEKAAPKAKKEPARGDLPEGYVTPIGLAKVLGEKGMQQNREGETLTEVRPQMVYSYMKNAPKDDPFPIETITDSLGKERQAVKLEAGLEWWTRKNERAASRKQNAAAKAAKKAEKAAAKEAEGDNEATNTEAVAEEAE
jgi:hypothetical protein